MFHQRRRKQKSCQDVEAPKVLKVIAFDEDQQHLNFCPCVAITLRKIKNDMLVAFAVWWVEK